MSDESDNKNLETRDEGGRFVQGKSGNPAGRPKGSKNKLTLIKQSLEEGLVDTLGEKSEQLLRTAITLAEKGDKDMLKFLLGRLMSSRGPDAEKELGNVGDIIFNISQMTNPNKPKIINNED